MSWRPNRAKEFDRGYGPMQVKVHEQAVRLFESYARGVDNPDLKAWAAKTLPHLKQPRDREETDLGVCLERVLTHLLASSLRESVVS
jgi:predicted outer membrane protein